MDLKSHQGFTPYRMRIDVAAAFCGEAVSSFREKVTAGALPPPAWREGRAVYWRTSDLIIAMEEGAVPLKTARQAAAPIDPDELKLAGA